MRKPNVNYSVEIFKFKILNDYLKIYNPTLKGFTLKEKKLIKTILENVSTVPDEIENNNYPSIFDKSLNIVNEYQKIIKKITQSEQLTEVYTPDKVSCLMNQLIFDEQEINYLKQNKNKKIVLVDITSGSGNLIIESLKYLRNKGINLSNRIYVIGQDINLFSNILFKILLDIEFHNELHLENQVFIYHGDTLLQPYLILEKIEKLLKSNNDNLEIYILSNPPFNLKGYNLKLIKKSLDKSFTKFYPLGLTTKSSADWLFLQLCSITYPIRKSIVLIDTSAFTRTNKKELNIRKQIIEHDLIEKIIFLPDDIFLTTKVSTCLILFNKNKSKSLKNKIEIIDLSELNYQKLIPDISTLEQQYKNDIKRIIVDLNTIKENNYTIGKYLLFDNTMILNNEKDNLDELKQQYEHLKYLTERQRKLENELFKLLEDVLNL